MATLANIQNIVDGTRYESVKKNFISNLYWEIKKAGFEVYILNDLYLNIEGTDYQFIQSKKNETYTAKAF